MHFQNRAEFWGRIFGQVVMQILQLCFDGVCGKAQSLDFFANLLCINKVMRHIHAARGHQHGAPNGNASGNSKSVDRKTHGNLLDFAKLVIEQILQGVHRCLLLVTICFKRDFAADTCSQHHHAHDAFCVDATIALADPNVTGKSASRFGELGRGTGMQAQFIADGDVFGDHTNERVEFVEQR